MPDPFAARADAELTPLTFMLAYVLANLVNEREGYAWPSIGHPAMECPVTERAVQKVIQRLIERVTFVSKKASVGAKQIIIIGVFGRAPCLAPNARFRKLPNNHIPVRTWNSLVCPNRRQ